VDQQLKHLMKELGEAINESLADSEQIADVVSRIKDGGYDIFLVLEATIGVSRPGEKSSDKTSMVTTLTSNPDLKVSEQDLKFLKSLRIKIEDDAAYNPLGIRCNVFREHSPQHHPTSAIPFLKHSCTIK